VIQATMDLLQLSKVKNEKKKKEKKKSMTLSSKETMT
jgi:hypothetical protein